MIWKYSSLLPPLLSVVYCCYCSFFLAMIPRLEIKCYFATATTNKQTNYFHVCSTFPEFSKLFGSTQMKYHPTNIAQSARKVLLLAVCCQCLVVVIVAVGLENNCLIKFFQRTNTKHYKIHCKNEHKHIKNMNKKSCREMRVRISV